MGYALCSWLFLFMGINTQEQKHCKNNFYIKMSKPRDDVILFKLEVSFIWSPVAYFRANIKWYIRYLRRNMNKHNIKLEYITSSPNLIFTWVTWNRFSLALVVEDDSHDPTLPHDIIKICLFFSLFWLRDPEWQQVKWLSCFCLIFCYVLYTFTLTTQPCSIL